MELKDSVTSAAQFFGYQKIDPKKLIQRLYFTKEECDAFDILYRTDPKWVMMRKESIERWFCKHHDLMSWPKFQSTVLRNLYDGINYRIIKKKDPTWSKYTTPDTLRTNNNVTRKFYVFTSECFLKICASYRVQLIDMHNKVERFREWKAKYDEVCDAYTPPPIVVSEAKMDAPIPPTIEDEIKEPEYIVVQHQHDLRLVNVIKERIGITNMEPQQLNLLINMLIASLKADINDDQFPVSLDDLAVILGYDRTRKLADLLKGNFDEKTDYIFAARVWAANNKVEKSHRGGHNKQHIRVTNDCAKELCSMRRNDVGKTVRKYFLVIEKLAKDYIHNPDNLVLPTIEDEIKEPERVVIKHPENNKLVEMIRGKITYKCNWSLVEIDIVINFLVNSMVLDHKKEKYPVMLGDLSSMLGYKRKEDSRKLITENFDEKTDYILASGQTEASHGGHNKIDIRLTISCAKRACMLSKTKKANDFRMYFIIVEELFKACIMDPTNGLINMVREEVYVRINPHLDNVYKYIEEGRLGQAYMGKDVIYIFRLHTLDTPDKRIYKYGQTHKFDKRGGEHSARFGCEVTLIKCWTIETPGAQISNFEASIGQFCKRINIKHTNEKYMSSNETFSIDESDNESLTSVIRYIDETIPTPIGNFEMRKMELEYEDKKSTREHEREMMKLQIEMRKLELSAKK